MTPAEIAALRALARGTSDGPWVAYRDVDGTWHVRTDTGGPEFDYGVADIPQARLGYSSPIDYRDASFIAAARTAVPDLLDEVERLEAVVAGTAYPSDATLTKEQALHGWHVANCQRSEWMDRALSAEAREAECRAALRGVLSAIPRQTATVADADRLRPHIDHARRVLGEAGKEG